MDEFFLDLVATGIGVFLGLVGTHAYETRQSRLADAEKRRVLSKGLVQACEQNLGLIDQAEKEIQKGHTPTFPMNRGFLEHARPHIYELIPAESDRQELDAATYEVQHLDTQLEMLRSLISNGSGAAGAFFTVIGPQLKSTRENLKKAIAVARKLSN